MIRKYKQKDYSDCIRILNDVWDFDSRYFPKELSELFKRTYLLTSLSESNFTVIIEEENKAQGFLFGNSGKKNLYKTEYSGLRGKLKLIMEMLSIKGVPLKRKLQYLRMEQIHERNRKKVSPDSENEINLFAVDPNAQGRGFGKLLIGEFIKYCRTRNAKKITLETDQESNYNFYYHLGFKKTGEFYSPSLKEYTGSSGNSYLFELELE